MAECVPGKSAGGWGRLAGQRLQLRLEGADTGQGSAGQALGVEIWLVGPSEDIPGGQAAGIKARGGTSKPPIARSTLCPGGGGDLVPTPISPALGYPTELGPVLDCGLLPGPIRQGGEK